MVHHTPQSQELRRIRLQLGLTQKDYGRALGIAPITVSHYECGQSPVPEPLLRLARTLLPHQGRSASTATPRQRTVGYPRGVPRTTDGTDKH